MLCRNCTQATYPWQWMLQRLQRSHQDQQHDIPTRPTPWPLAEQSWKGDPNVQGPFCSNSLWPWYIVPSKPLGPPFMPSRAHSQHVATITNDSHSIGLRIPLGATWLQCKPFCTPGMQGRIIFGTRHSQDMGVPHSNQILRWNGMGTLLLPQSIYHWHPPHPNLQLGIFLAQISHHAIPNAFGHPHPRSWRSYYSYHRSHNTSQHDNQHHQVAHQDLQGTSRERERWGNTSKGVTGECTSWKGASRTWHRPQGQLTSPWPDLPLPKQHFFSHLRLKSTLMWTWAHYKEPQ